MSLNLSCLALFFSHNEFGMFDSLRIRKFALVTLFEERGNHEVISYLTKHAQEQRKVHKFNI